MFIVMETYLHSCPFVFFDFEWSTWRQCRGNRVANIWATSP